ncbi:alanine racemase [bacterium]|nr:alanine racemase [bacterium]
MDHRQIQHPSLVIDEQQARANIRWMADKARNAGVRFRPHFKTHQSAAVGEWFRDEGVDRITVSSYSMARYFAEHGWSDITLAFPLNLRELAEIEQLASTIQLGVLVDSVIAVLALAERTQAPLNVWIKLDTGYGRAGVRWDQTQQLIDLASRITQTDHLRFAGLLTHNGQAYHVQGEHAIRAIYQESTTRMLSARTALHEAGFADVRLSTGDTPCCSVVDDFLGVDEIRPGNFVYYDLMQTAIGSCPDERVAAVVACPVVGVYPERLELILYGGAVHLSKESIELDGRPVYGCLAEMDGDRIAAIRRDAPVISLSQEHGKVHLPPDLLSSLRVGDLAYVVPVHSCLAVSCLQD